jgi:predicted ribosome quality control (RQC) complex YloA/Tae2 family protein
VLSLRELERAVRILDAEACGSRVEKIVQPDESRLVLSLRDAGHVLVSCRPGSARLSRLAERPQGQRTPPAFLAFLRKRVGRATLTGIRLVGGDRQVALTLAAKEGELDLVLSILGPRSNVYLLDADGILLQSLRPLARTRRTLALGEAWRNPDTPAPARGEDRFAQVEDGGFFEAVEAHYAGLEAGEEAEDHARRLGQALSRERKALERRLAALRRDLEAAGEAEGLRRQGELLKVALDRVEPGADAVRVQDFETGEEVEIPLDPSRSPRENLEAVFKRYRKRSRSLEPVTAQLGEVEARLAENAELAAALEARSGDAVALAALAERPDARRLLARYAPRPPPQTRRRRETGPSARLRPRRYAASGGLEIWVGRSDEGNDHLTMRLARGKDLFLHLEGSPGSHVILRTEGRDDPPSEALLEAAELAVHFSKHRKVTRADIHVVPVKNISKPRGAKPGLVYVTGGRSLRLRREPARLKRVLDARIHDADA